VQITHLILLTVYATRKERNLSRAEAFTIPTASQNILLVGGCGYIGCFLYQQLDQLGFNVTVVDQLKRGNPLGLNVIADDYSNLPHDMLAQFDAVLWFAGHSSVGQSIADPEGALVNNCLNLFSFAKRLAAHTKLIYASSGSLYSTKTVPAEPASEYCLANIPTNNAYDISKFAFDYLAESFLCNYFALRMGTVSGYSPNLRAELVFNAMNIAAATSGRVHLKNSDSYRTILFLSDLWTLVHKLLVTPQKPGVYNVGSLSFKLGDLASKVAATWKAQVVDEGNSDTYSFQLDITRMKAICGDGLSVTKFSQQCRNFIRQYQATG